MRTIQTTILGIPFAVFCLLAAPAVAQDGVQDTLDEHTELIEDLTYDLDALAKDLRDPNGKVDVHGFIAQGFIQSNTNNYLVESDRGTFAYNEVGFNLGTQISPKTRAGIQIFSRDLGNIDNNKVTIDWAILDHRYSDALGFRFGKIKTPLGFYNETRDIDGLRTPILLPSSVYSEPFRDVSAAMWGLGLYGNLPAGVSYQVVSGTVNIATDSGVGRAIDDSGLFSTSEIRADYATAASLKWETPIEGLQLGISGYLIQLTTDAILNTTLPGPIPAGTSVVFDLNNYYNWVYSAEYTVGDLVLSAEYSEVRYDSETSALLGPNKVEIIRNQPNPGGYYGMATYQLNDTVQIGAYYSVEYGDLDEHSAAPSALSPTTQDFEGYKKDACLTTRFDLSDNVVLKLEAHRVRGAYGLLLSENPNGFDKDWNMFLAKLSMSF